MGKGYVIALLVTIGLTAAYVWHRDLRGKYEYYLENEKYVQTVQDQLETLKQEEQRLQERVDGLDNNDPVEVEADLRRDRKLVRPGEKIFRVELEPDGSAQQGVVTEP